jgi:hypothetical protein
MLIATSGSWEIAILSNRCYPQQTNS